MAELIRTGASSRSLPLKRLVLEMLKLFFGNGHGKKLLKKIVISADKCVSVVWMSLAS